MRDTLLLEIVQPPFEIGVLLDEIMVAVLVHLVAMIVDPQISVALTAIHQPHPKERVEGIVVNGYWLRGVPMENRLLARGPRVNGLLSYSSDALSRARAASVENTIGMLVQAL